MELFPLVLITSIQFGSVFIRKLTKHVIFTLFRMISLTIAYILMLIVMNDYYGHLLAVVFGFTVGHYFFDTNMHHYKTKMTERIKKSNENNFDNLSSNSVQPSTSSQHIRNYGSVRA